MNIKDGDIAKIFNEWAHRYQENPDSFDAVLDESGNVVEDYGKRCEIYFKEIFNDLNKNDANQND